MFTKYRNVALQSLTFGVTCPRGGQNRSKGSPPTGSEQTDHKQKHNTRRNNQAIGSSHSVGSSQVLRRVGVFERRLSHVMFAGPRGVANFKPHGKSEEIVTCVPGRAKRIRCSTQRYDGSSITGGQDCRIVRGCGSETKIGRIP